MKWIDVGRPHRPDRPAKGERPAAAGKRPARPAPEGRVAAALRDAYAQWALISDFRGFTNNRFVRRQRPRTPARQRIQEQQERVTAGEWVSFIARARSADDIDAIARTSTRPRPGAFAYVPPAYLEAIPGTAERSLHFTGRVRRADLHRLAEHPGIESWELGLPVAVPDVGQPDDRAPRLGATAAASQPARQVIAVIDYGCALLNTAFCDRSGRKTRIHHYWDQGLVASAGWRQPHGFKYGSAIDAATIDAILQERRAAERRGDGTDEAVDYRRLGQLHYRARYGLHIRRTAHGTHVLDTVGGRVDPWTQKEDAASEAHLVFVELPFQTAADGSGGSLAVHLLDGVREVLAVSTADAKIAVSISQGTHAGPHDGSSLIERAFDELLEKRPRDFCIVIGAGNARHSQGHARTVVRPGETVELALDVPVQDRTDTFVELWYPRVVDGQGTEIVVGVAPPGVAPVEASAGQAQALQVPPVGRARASNCVAALIHRASASNGQDALALLALAPADRERFDAGRRVPAGVWRVQVSNRGTQAVPIDAYVERDEPVTAAALAYPKFLPQSGREGAVRRVGPTEQGTLNTLCTGEHTIVVGACFRHTGEASPYSSHGPVRGGPRVGRRVPEVLAAADESTVLPGLRAAAVRSGTTVRMNGTSVAAPTLARRLYNVMVDRTVSRDQWREVIRDLARDDCTGILFLPSSPRIAPRAAEPAAAGGVPA